VPFGTGPNFGIIIVWDGEMGDLKNVNPYKSCPARRANSPVNHADWSV